MVKSPKRGEYTFVEEIVDPANVKDFLDNK
jgi:hypothetical protein